MKNKILLTVGAVLLPFILIWVAAICTAGVVNPMIVFSEPAFWGFSTMYWIFFMFLVIGVIWESK